MKKIYLATDHAGFEFKNLVRDFLEREYKDTYEIIDYGAFTFDELDNYTDFIPKAAQMVSKNLDDRAIIFGGSGQGEAMLANRYPNVRAVVYYGYDPKIVSTSREHNDSNVLSIGARFAKQNELEEIIRLWLQTNSSDNPKYQKRIDQAEKLTQRKILFKLF